MVTIDNYHSRNLDQLATSGARLPSSQPTKDAWEALMIPMAYKAHGTV